MPHGGPHGSAGPSGQAYQSPGTMSWEQYLLGSFFESTYMQDATWWDYTNNQNAWSGMEDIQSDANTWGDFLNSGYDTFQNYAINEFGDYIPDDWATDAQMQSAYDFFSNMQQYQESGSPVDNVYIPSTEGTFGVDINPAEGTTFFTDWDYDWGDMPWWDDTPWTPSPGGSIGGAGDLGTGGFAGGGSMYAQLQGGIKDDRSIWEDTMCDNGPIFGGDGSCIACCELLAGQTPPGNIESAPGGGFTPGKKSPVRSAPRSNQSLQNNVKRRY
mgnify:CR=1 FL=1